MEDIICRICGIDLARHSVGIEIFKAQGSALNLSKKIQTCLPISVKEDDSLTKIICRQCAAQLDLFYMFQEKSKETDVYLKTVCLSNSLINQESCNPNVVCDSREKLLSRNSVVEESVTPQRHQELVFCEPFISVKEEQCNDSTSNYASKQYLHDNEHEESASSKIPETCLLLKNMIPFTSAEAPTNSNDILNHNLDKGTVKMKIIYQCAYCNLNFASHNDSEAHILQIHSRERQKRVSSNSVLQHHSVDYFKKKSTPEKKIATKTTTMFRCTYCKLIFHTREASANHILEEHKKERQERFALTEIKQNTCVATTEETNLAPMEEKNIKSTKQEVTVFRCTYCKLIFTTRADTKDHIKKEHKKDHTCDYCYATFRTSDALSVHEEMCWIHKIKKNKIKNIECNFCSMKYFEKHDLERHILKCHVCTLCGNLYKDMAGNGLKYHKICHELPIEKRKTIKCTKCDASFLTKSNLIIHLRKHTGERPFKCHLCPKKYISREGLRRHLFLHTGIKSYLCQICGKAFAKNEYLMVHERVHTGQRPYMCDVCGKRFTQRSSLTVHNKLHNISHPYACDKCGKSMKSKNAFVVHVKQHFKCS